MPSLTTTVDQVTKEQFEKWAANRGHATKSDALKECVDYALENLQDTTIWDLCSAYRGYVITLLGGTEITGVVDADGSFLKVNGERIKIDPAAVEDCHEVDVKYITFYAPLEQFFIPMVNETDETIQQYITAKFGKLLTM